MKIERLYRSLVTAVVVVAAIYCSGCIWRGWRVPDQNGEAGLPSTPVISAWLLVGETEAETTLGQVLRPAREELLSEASTVRDAAGLIVLLEAAVRSILERSADPYKAVVLGEHRVLHAGPMMDFLRNEVRPRVLPESANGLSPDETFFYLLDHPEARRMTLEAVDQSSIRTGWGTQVDYRLEWAVTGAFSQLSLVQPPEGGFFRQTQADAMDARSESYWIEFRGRFAEGYQARLRLLFYYNRDLECWMPLAAVLEDTTRPRPWPLF